MADLAELIREFREAVEFARTCDGSHHEGAEQDVAAAESALLAALAPAPSPDDVALVDAVVEACPCDAKACIDHAHRVRTALLARLRQRDDIPEDDETVRRVAKALYASDCKRADADEIRAGRKPPEKWADPWHESGCGIRQQKPYLDDARAAIGALKGK